MGRQQSDASKGRKCSRHSSARSSGGLRLVNPGQSPILPLPLSTPVRVLQGDAVLAAGLGAHPTFLPRLRELLLPHQASTAGLLGTQAMSSRSSSRGPSRSSASGEQPTAERLAMYAAYLVSVLGGKSLAIDDRLLDLRFVPALAAAATASANGARGVKRGTLRALSKLLEAQPAFAAAQLAACGGVPAVAALLPGDGCTRGNCGGCDHRPERDHFLASSALARVVGGTA